MAAIGRILRDERSAIGMRHAGLASMLAAASVAAGIFLIVAGSQLYERRQPPRALGARGQRRPRSRLSPPPRASHGIAPADPSGAGALRASPACCSAPAAAGAGSGRGLRSAAPRPPAS